MKKKKRNHDEFIQWLVQDWLAPLGILALVIWVVVKLAQFS